MTGVRIDVPGPGRCRYILDDGPWYDQLPLWCAAPVLAGEIYCATHFKKCHQAQGLSKRPCPPSRMTKPKDS